MHGHPEAIHTAEALATGDGRNGHVATTDGNVYTPMCPCSNATRGNVDVTVTVADD